MMLQPPLRLVIAPILHVVRDRTTDDADHLFEPRQDRLGLHAALDRMAPVQSGVLGPIGALLIVAGLAGPEFDERLDRRGAGDDGSPGLSPLRIDQLPERAEMASTSPGSCI